MITALVFGVAVSGAALVVMTVWDCLDRRLTGWRASRDAVLVDECCCRGRP